MGKDDGLGRRGFLTGVSAAAGAVAAGAPLRSLARDTAGAEAAADGSTARLFTPGTMVGEFRVVRSYALHLGALPVVLEAPGGVRFQVDVLRRDPNPRRAAGIGNTATMSVYLANRGDGETATVEEQGLGAMALATALAAGATEAGPGLLTLAQRHERFPGGAYSVPLA